MRTAELEAAFRATTYQVETPEGIYGLRIGLPNRAFDEFLGRRGVSCWGLVTACNPGGVKDEHGNAGRQHRLHEMLREQGRSFLAVRNIADDGLWPVEPAYLLLQASERETCKLAAGFDQLACVCAETGTSPRLVWT